MIELRPWSDGDLPLLRRLLGDPGMMLHLGGPETPEQIAERHARYLKIAAGSETSGVFKVVCGGEDAGWVGYWDFTWRDEPVYETGWSVLPEFQGRGIACRATRLLMERLRAEGKRRFVHAFPRVSNAASNAICRKLGFDLVEEADFEYPKGQFSRTNNWRLDLRPGGDFTPRDFGKAAADYGAHRKGFPDSFFERMSREEVGTPGQRILDLGTGTGTLVRGFARRGAAATGLDISPELMEQARALGEGEGVRVEYVVGRAEQVPFPDASFDVVSAGQCWHWFDGPAAAAECLRVLKPGGCLVIAHFCYLLASGNMAQRTEDLILRYNPGWPLAGGDGRYEKWRDHMEPAGFRDVRAWDYDEDVPFGHEGWRGRIRACNGVLALGDPARMGALDRDLERLLKAEFPSEPMRVPHRVFAILGRRP
jgi:SAM-dependent methyltransferase/RimJ/RimL family protein N-acetyltransferase